MRGPFLRLQKGTQMCDLVIMKARNNLAATVCTFLKKVQAYHRIYMDKCFYIVNMYTYYLFPTCK